MATSAINTECKRYGCMKNLLACYANCRYNTRCDELRKEIENKTDQAALDINTYLTERGKGVISIQFPKRGLKFIEANQKRAEAKKVAPARPARPPRPAGDAKQLASISKSSPPRLELRVASPPALKADAKKPSKVLKRSAAPRRKKKRAPSAVSGRGRTETAASRPAPASEQKPGKRLSEMPGRVKQKNRETPREITAMNNKSNGNADAIENTTAIKSARARRPKRNGAGSKSRKGKVYIIIEGKTANIVDEKGLMTHLFNNSAAGARYFEATEVEARVQIVPKP